MRVQPPDLLGAFAEAFDCATSGVATLPELTSLRRAGEAAVASAEAHAAGRNEPPYHDRHHFVEVTLAMGWLLANARGLGLIEPLDTALGVVAMAAHDLGHDGSLATDGTLEARSAAQATALAHDAGVCPTIAARIAYVIEGTDPSALATNTARSRGLAETGAQGRTGDWLRSLAHEADVLASLLPVLGPLLAERLAAERRLAGAQDADFVSSFAGRVCFLRLHDWFTPAAVALGLEAITTTQLATLAFAARQLGGTAAN